MPYKEFRFNGTVGKPLVRRGGREKVTGAAKFTAEWPIDGMLYAMPVVSTIAKGQIISIDADVARKMPGVRLVLPPDNAPSLKQVPTMSPANNQTSLASSIYPVSGHEVYHAGQLIAAVVADRFETARDAALLVEVKYEPGKHVTDIEDAPADERPKSLFGAPPVIEIGDAEKELKASTVSIDSEYILAGNHHNPMEPHATTAHWTTKEGKPFLTVYDATQGLVAAKMTYAQIFGLKPEQVRVICQYVGGGFGSKTSWPHAILAIACAKVANAPVKLSVSRQHLYGAIGHRTPMQQRIAIGAERDGTIRSMIHSGVATTSQKDDYAEAFTMATRMMYRTTALRLDQKQCRLNSQSPTFMRAPAETPGMYVLESAIDELAVALNMDPIELRIKNEPERDLLQKKPFSGRLLVDCLKQGAEKFGWKERSMKPREKKDGAWLIGMGVAAATYPAFSFPTSARVPLNADGTARIDCCSQEIGTGTETVQTQLLADLLDIAPTRVTMELGDTDLPPGGLSGGSATTMSVGGAIVKAVDKLKSELANLAPKDSKLANSKPDAIKFKNGRVVVDDEATLFEDLLKQRNRSSVTGLGEFNAGHDTPTSNHSFGATFVEVAVDEELGLIRLRRLLGQYACGTLLNANTARSQFIGGIIMGVGHALQEETRWEAWIRRQPTEIVQQMDLSSSLTDIDTETDYLRLKHDFSAAEQSQKTPLQTGPRRKKRPKSRITPRLTRLTH